MLPSGICGVCSATHRIRQDGKLRQHGSHSRPCPGSHHPPSATLSVSQPNSDSSNTSSDTSSSQPSSSAPVLSAPQPYCSPSHPSINQPVIKHIPKSVRFHCAKSLGEIIDKLAQNYCDVSHWIKLLNFASHVLLKPNRVESDVRISDIIKKRINSYSAQTDFTSRDFTENSSKRGSKPPNPNEQLARLISSKIEDGNLRAASRILNSDDKIADNTTSTHQQLADKHPLSDPQRDFHALPEPFDSSISPLQVTDQEVLKGINSFPAGSSGGPDGIRPKHLLDLVNSQDSHFIGKVTKLVNLLLAGHCPTPVAKFLFGANLTALEKKSGGIRPIAVGYVWRRLAAKCAAFAASSKLHSYFQPRQLGVGTRGGCEAAVHACRRFMDSMPDDHVLAKLDFSNAFNSIHRDSMLQSVLLHVPEIYPLCWLSYRHDSVLKFRNFEILSQEGVQQGDPLGPLLFSLSIHPLLQNLHSDLVVGYMDDLSLGGSEVTVATDIDNIISAGHKIGLKLNTHKCEIISKSNSHSSNSFADFVRVNPGDATLLGAPLSAGQAMDNILQQKLDNLIKTSERLKLISAHDALVLLKSCCGVPSITYLLRCAPCVGHTLLPTFDNQLRIALSSILNVSLDTNQWIQASLPVKSGGLGIRKATDLAAPAFLASFYTTSNLQDNLLVNLSPKPVDTYFEQFRQEWTSTHNCPLPPYHLAVKQSSWSKPIIDASKEELVATQVDDRARARLLAAAAPHSGDWLNALPVSACGLRLTDDGLRVAAALRLGAKVCESHTCPCGTDIDCFGSHIFSCKRNINRINRHSYLNDLIYRALVRAGVPSRKEPTGLSRTDNKRPDGLTLIPWAVGKAAVWDVTVVDTTAASYLQTTSIEAGRAADLAAERKEAKYMNLSAHYNFIPVAIETCGPISRKTLKFLSELGRRLTAVSGDHRETAFLFQRLSMGVQRFCGAFLQESFAEMNDQPNAPTTNRSS